MPIDRIKVQKHNVRLHDIDAGVDDLAASIKAHGLIEPIVAYRSDDTYFILTGQRRFNAYNKLNKDHPGEGFDRIPCFVRDEPQTDDQKKALSLAENITQLPMNESDLVKAVTDLYNVYSDYKIVQEKFGLSRHMVDKYVKRSRLPQELKTAIDNNELGTNPRKAVNMAIRAVDAYSYTEGDPTPISDVLKLAKAMANGSVDLQDAKKGVESGMSITEMEDMKNNKVPLKIHLSTDVDKKLDVVAKSKDSNKNVTAVQYIIKGVERDYEQVEDI